MKCFRRAVKTHEELGVTGYNDVWLEKTAIEYQRKLENRYHHGRHCWLSHLQGPLRLETSSSQDSDLLKTGQQVTNRSGSRIQPNEVRRRFRKVISTTSVKSNFVKRHSCDPNIRVGEKRIVYVNEVPTKFDMHGRNEGKCVKIHTKTIGKKLAGGESSNHHTSVKK